MSHSALSLRRGQAASLAASLVVFLAAGSFRPADAVAAEPEALPADRPGITLAVTIRGLAGTTGEVGCALYPETSASRFPLGASSIASQWMAADTQPLRCVWPGLPAGRYAVAVSHDVNGNRRTDTNLVGMPTEAWGVSRDARPWLRAPRFDEAMIELGDASSREIAVRLAR